MTGKIPEASGVQLVTAVLYLLDPSVTCALDDESADPLIESWNGMIVWIILLLSGS